MSTLGCYLYVYYATVKSVLALYFLHNSDLKTFEIKMIITFAKGSSVQVVNFTCSALYSVVFSLLILNMNLLREVWATCVQR